MTKMAYTYTKLAKAKELNTNKIKEVATYSFAIVLCILILIWFLQLWNADINVPFAYNGDSIAGGVDIKGTIDNGWFLNNKYIGAPTGLEKYDFPQPDNLHYLWFRLIALFTSKYAVVMNVYFLLTFPLTTIISLFVLRQLKLSYLSAMVGSLLFTFLPYHFMRIGHLILAAYYLIPLTILVILWVCGLKEPLFFKKEADSKFRINISNPKSIASIIIAILIASSGIYYTFFTVFFLLVAGILAYSRQKKMQFVLPALVLIAIIGLTVIVNVSPNILFNYKNGTNKELNNRDWSDAEVYGLKITQLMLPVDNHIIPRLAALRKFYDSKAPLNTENTTATLGFIGSIGFLSLIIWLFFKLPGSLDKDENDKLITNVSVLNLAAVLLATIGGFGSLVAMKIFSAVRGYNRISLYIAFFSLLALFLLVEKFNSYYLKRQQKQFIFFGIIILILIVGIFDQSNSGKFAPPYDSIKRSFQNDAAFIKKIELQLPKNSMIFQLPYTCYPEPGPISQMGPFELFKGYLHSNNLYWSYGTMKGRETDLWQRQVVRKQSKDFLKEISLAGFNGLYIDRFAYAGSAVKPEDVYKRVLKEEPIVSRDNRLVFFSMLQYNKALRKKYSSNRWNQMKSKILSGIKK